MSTKNTVQIDARREEFRKYLEKEGILESLTKSLVIIFLYLHISLIYLHHFEISSVGSYVSR